MNIVDVKKFQANEKKSVRINIRLTPSQMKFIEKNDLSISKIMNVALKQLGYEAPKLSEIPSVEKDRGYRKDKKEKPHIKHIKKHRR